MNCTLIGKVVLNALRWYILIMRPVFTCPFSRCKISKVSFMKSGARLRNTAVLTLLCRFSEFMMPIYGGRRS